MENEATITANKKFVQQFIDRVFNEHNAAATRDYFSPDVKWHGGTLGTIEGSDAMTDFYGTLFTALPDLHATTLDVVADGDTVNHGAPLKGAARNHPPGVGRLRVLRRRIEERRSRRASGCHR
jgi:predicted SnoaL-like aldol condensation-catalyzing enzyme